jgi:DNA polymerase III delta prime subunit
MGQRKLKVAGVMAEGSERRAKLATIAQRLGISPEELWKRVDADRRLLLFREEATKIKGYFEGKLPTVKGVTLVESEEPGIFKQKPPEEERIIRVKEGPIIEVAGKEPVPAEQVEVPAEELDRRPASELCEELRNPDCSERTINRIVSIKHRGLLGSLVWQLEDPWKQENIKKILLKKAEDERERKLIINFCVGALANPECKESVKEILVKIAERDAQKVVNPLVGALANPERVESVKEILVKIAERDAQKVVNPLVGALANPERVESVKEILVKIAERDAQKVVNPLVGALANPERVESVKEILVKIAERDAQKVVNPLVGALANPERVESVKEILVKIAERDAQKVVNPLVGALADPERVESAKEILVKIAERDPIMVSNSLTIILKDEKIRSTCTEMLKELIRKETLVFVSLLFWENRDQFNRRPIIEEIILDFVNSGLEKYANGTAEIGVPKEKIMVAN